MKAQTSKSSTDQTVRQLLAESYANLGMAHAAVKGGASGYGRTHFMIRSKLRKGLLLGTMMIRPLADDEKLKLVLPQACSYCGKTENLSVDHLIPTAGGGPNSGENFVWACRSCNSSKGARDLLQWWFTTRDTFPPILLLRRYLKIAWQLAESSGVLDKTLGDATGLPFSVERIPLSYPTPDRLMLWIIPLD